MRGLIRIASVLDIRDQMISKACATGSGIGFCASRERLGVDQFCLLEQVALISYPQIQRFESSSHHSSSSRAMLYNMTGVSKRQKCVLGRRDDNCARYPH